MVKRCRFIIMMISITIALSACMDSRSPEQVAYTHGLGLDYKDGKYIVYLQLINMGLLAKTEGAGGSGEEVNTELGIGTGENIDDAIFNLYESAQQEIYWGSMAYIILSERFLKEEGIMSAIDTWSRHPETRYQTNLYSTSDDLEKMLLTEPVMDVSKALSLLADPRNSFRQSSYGIILDFRSLLIALKEPPRLAVIPSVAVADKSWERKGSNRPVAKMSGLTLFDSNKKFLGTLSGETVDGYRWVNKDFYRANVLLEGGGKTIGSVVVNKRKLKIKPIVKGHQVTFKMTIKVQAHISEINEKLNYRVAERLTAKKIKKEVMSTYLDALEIHEDADIYRLGEMLYRKDVKAWKRLSREKNIKLNKDSLDVHVEVLVKDSWRDHLKREVE